MQMMLNAAARLVGAGSLITSLRYLRDVLHWLPVSQWIQFKVAVARSTYCFWLCPRLWSTPAYFKDVCIPLDDICSRSNLRSAQRGDMDMVVPRTIDLSFNQAYTTSSENIFILRLYCTYLLRRDAGPKIEREVAWARAERWSCFGFTEGGVNS